MLIKVCGIADEANARRVAALGPDMMGFIFYAPSPRNAFPLAPVAVKALSGDIRKVGVFVDEPKETIFRIAESYDLDAVQLHGKEAPELCAALQDYGLPVIKAFGIASVDDLARTAEYENCCDMFLFDTKTASKGGSGIKFDHCLLKAYTGGKPYLLSGGIGPEDTAAIATGLLTGCRGYDLNSRFESSPGIKNISLLENFINTIRHYNL